MLGRPPYREDKRENTRWKEDSNQNPELWKYMACLDIWGWLQGGLEDETSGRGNNGGLM